MKSNPFLPDLAAIAAQVSVVDDYTYQVRGRQFPVAYQQAYTKWHQPLQHFGQNSGDADQVRANLRQQLAGALYGTYYCTGTTTAAAAPPAEATALPPLAERERTMRLLSAANCTPNGFDPHWTVYALDNFGNAFVSKNGALRQLAANQWVFANPAETTLRIGSVVQLTITKEDTTLQPVFYHVRGTELVSQQAEFVRVYFNTDFEGALELVQGITSTCNEYRLPFLFKCLNHPALFTRADSAVLYISKFDFHLTQRLLRPILARLRPHLKPAVPLFTRPLEPGVSFCEDPATGQSFGMSRCLLLTEALLAAYDKQLPPGESQLTEIERVLTKNGLASARIYLNANSHFPYCLPPVAYESALAAR